MDPIREWLSFVDEVVALSERSGMSLADASQVLDSSVEPVTEREVAKVARFRAAVADLDEAFREV